MLGVQEQTSSAITPVLVAFTVNLIIATQEASSNTAACDVLKRGIVKRYPLVTRLSHGCLSSFCDLTLDKYHAVVKQLIVLGAQLFILKLTMRCACPQLY